MQKTITVATIQMDATPSSVSKRLDRAEEIIKEAAQSGAQLVILPELFNIGYAYTDGNFSLAEPVDGKTSMWMKALSARLNIHLGGTFLITDKGEIYNSFFLFSPSGKQWRYDKNYPWAWERGYFRAQRKTTVAHTELGDFGMLICWDVAHRNLWRQYAGQVDMMLISSSPPDGPNATYQFADGSQFNFDDLGSIMKSLKDLGEKTFGEMVDQQTKWLEVPAVNSGATGSVNTKIPRAKLLILGILLLSPRLIKQLRFAHKMQMKTNMISSCKIVNQKGQRLAERTPNEGEGYTTAKVDLQTRKPIPNSNQPKTPLNLLAYLNSDIFVPFLMQSVYNNGKKKINSVQNPES